MCTSFMRWDIQDTFPRTPDKNVVIKCLLNIDEENVMSGFHSM